MSRRAPLIALVLMLAAVVAGAVFLSRGDDTNGVGIEAGDASTTTRQTVDGRPTSTTTSTTSAPRSGFPTDVPESGDEECSLPETDDHRPTIAEAGEPTDGVEVGDVSIRDSGDLTLTFSAPVSHRPVVSAGSGEQWVVIQMHGVRRVDPERLTVESDHARPLPASLCDDSGFAWAFAFDSEVTALELVQHTNDLVEIAITLA